MTGTIAITGASGMLGRHLVRAFHERGWTVRALARSPDASDDRPHVTWHRGDLPDALDASAFAGVDVVMHAAWATRAVDAATARRTNHDGTQRVIEAARDAGVPRLVFISSVAARADAPSAYGRSKHVLESAFDGPRDLVLRPGLVLAPHGGLFGRLRDSIARSSLVPLFGGGRQIIQTIHVDDLLEAIVRALDHTLDAPLALAEPEGLTFRAFLEAIAGRLDRRLRPLPVPYAPALLALRAAERLGLRLPITSENLLGLKAMRHVPTREDLGRLGLGVRTAHESLDDLMPHGAG